MMTLMVLELMTANKKCDSSNKDNYCYESKKWTFPVKGISKNDISIIKNGNNYTNFTVSTIVQVNTT